MRKPRSFLILFCLAWGCSEDYLTGQPGEPPGPLQLTHLTLLDTVSRDQPVFTDTAAPPDCSDPKVANTPACFNEPYGDKYGVKKSQPTPDSGDIMRAVFDKIPYQLNHQDLEMLDPKTMMVNPNSMIPKEAIDLACEGTCTAVPPLVRTLIVTGFSRSPVPTDPRLGLGPALQMGSDTGSDPLAALEPDTGYHVVLSPNLSGRDGDVIGMAGLQMGDALLHFTTEPFKILQVGIADPADDPYVYSNTSNGDGSAASPYVVSGLAENGVVSILLNAGVYEPAFQSGSATAMVDGKSVPVKLGLSQLTKDMQGKTVCNAGNQRTIYLFPGTMDGTWGMMAKQLTLTLHGADVRDISQAAGHPQGRHALPSDIVVSAMLTGSPADPMSYKGLTSDTVSSLADCPK